MALAALLDANVLFSAPIRDTLLRWAERDLYRPLWTVQILDEMARALKAQRPDIEPVRIDRLILQILEAFPEALIDGYQDLIPAMRNHEGDRHVLAAAVRAGADAIVTSNTSHFSHSACAPYGIDVWTPDELLYRLWEQSAAEMALVLRDQARDLRNPPMTVEGVLGTLSRHAPRFIDTARRSGLF